MGSSEKWSRALMATGEGLQQMAGYTERREVEAARAMREESLVRLRGQQAKELADTRFERDQEMATTKYQRDLAVENVRSQNQRELMQDRDDYQERRIRRQELQDVERQGNARIKAIDAEIGKAQAMLDKARLEGTLMDEQARAEIEARIGAFREQKVSEQFRTLMMLKDMEHEVYGEKDQWELMELAGYDKGAVDASRRFAEGGGEAAPADDADKRPYADWQSKYESGDYKGAPEKKLDSGKPADTSKITRLRKQIKNLLDSGLTHDDAAVRNTVDALNRELEQQRKQQQGRENFATDVGRALMGGAA